MWLQGVINHPLQLDNVLLDWAGDAGAACQLEPVLKVCGSGYSKVRNGTAAGMLLDALLELSLASTSADLALRCVQHHPSKKADFGARPYLAPEGISGRGISAEVCGHHTRVHFHDVVCECGASAWCQLLPGIRCLILG